MTIEDIKARIPDNWGKYVDIGEGWQPTVVLLDKRLAELDPNYTVAQVKEKFGGLRYYLLEINPEVREEADRLIGLAEQICSATCDTCGQPGETSVTNGWYRTLCQDCLLARNAGLTGYPPT